MVHPYQYSLVVDWLPMHSYQAEILLFTLEEFGRVPRDRIVVQCSDRVTEEVRLEFERSGYRTSIFASCPDGMHSNEVARLDSLLEHSDPSANGFFLLNPGLAVLAPLEISDPSIVWGKVADVPGPSLESLKRLFSEADLDLPNVVPCDLQEMGDTIATNMDGGFLYIPLPLASRLRLAWRRWAEFLFSRSDHPCDDPSMQAHIGRISFAMALASERIPFSHLPANWNFPCHTDRTPRTFRPEEYLRVLRYRENLDAFGLIAPAYLDAAVNAAVERINAAVGRRSGTMFFDMYKQHLARQALALAPAMTKETFSSAFVARTWIGDRKRRLILHAGTPKTGTSSLQRHLSDNRKVLADNGWWYPEPSDWKHMNHQRLVSVLRSADERAFVEYAETALRDMPDHAHTVVFSAEGIFNHWSDYPPRAKGLLQRLAALFDFELCVWFRPPEDFAISFYAQRLREPGFIAGDVTGKVYGTDSDFIDAMLDEWFRARLDYLGFYHEALQLFGCGRVKAFLYMGDTVRTFLDRFGIDGLPAYYARQNVSLRPTGTEMMRIVNRIGLDGMQKARVEELIFEIDGIIGECAGEFRLTRAERDLVLRYAQRGWDVLQPLLSGGDERDPVREA